MSPSDIVTDAVVLALDAVACFIAFRALELRRALVDSSYRSRAFWTAIGALTLVTLSFAQFFPEVNATPTNYPQVIEYTLFWGFLFLGLYGWVSSNGNVAVRADYFNRDILFWKRGGRQAVLSLVVIAFVIFNLPPWWWTGLSTIDYNIIGDVANAFVALAAIYALIVISISYVRIKDRRIKAYTLWVALSIVTLVAGLVLSGVIGLVSFVAFLFFMYRAVSSLAIRTRSLPAAISGSTGTMG